MIKFKELAGVPVCYDRIQKYGDPAVCRGEYGRPELVEALDNCFAALWDLTGKAEVILTAGAYTRKPGWHGKGLAFDLDGLLFKGRRFMALGYTAEPRFYLGVEAVLRGIFPGTVLNYRYNRAHHDHWHLQLDRVRNLRGTRSQVVWLQDALNHLGGAGLTIDGVFGPKTRAAYDKARGTRGWLTFCLWAAAKLLPV